MRLYATAFGPLNRKPVYSQPAGRIQLSQSLLLDGGDKSIGGHGLRSLDGQAKRSVPHQAGAHSQRAGNSEQDSVVVHLLHSIIL